MSRGFFRARECHRVRVTQAAGKWPVTQQRLEAWVASGHGRDDQAYGRQPSSADAPIAVNSSEADEQFHPSRFVGSFSTWPADRSNGRTPNLRVARRGKIPRGYDLTCRDRRSYRCFPLTSRREETGLGQNKDFMVPWWSSGEYTIQYDGEGMGRGGGSRGDDNGNRLQDVQRRSQSGHGQVKGGVTWNRPLLRTNKTECWGRGGDGFDGW